jgi:transposase InsO family protein
LALVEAIAAGRPVAAVAREYPISERTAWKWWRRYQAEGRAGLQDRSSRPHHSPRAHPAAVRRAIGRRRRQRWSSLRIARELGLPVSSVVHIQRQLGWARLAPRQPRPPVIRYERRQPGALVHLDVKKLARIGRVGHRWHGDRRRRARGVGWEYLHVAIDDATRLAYAELYPDETAVSASAFLTRAAAWLRQQGVRLQAVMTDNGSGYRGHCFAAVRASLGARHLWTRPYTPRTNGKAERFIRTALAEWAYARAYRTSLARAATLGDFLHYYNTARPHSGLGYVTPMQRLAERL